MTFSIIDIVIAAILLLFLVRGFAQGFLLEAASVVGVLVGFLLARTYSEPFGIFLQDFIPETSAYVLAFALIVIGGMLGCGLLARFLRIVLKIALAGWIDRILGAVFGLSKGALLVSICIYIYHGLTKKLIVEDSLFLPYYNQVINAIGYIF